MKLNPEEYGTSVKNIGSTVHPPLSDKIISPPKNFFTDEEIAKLLCPPDDTARLINYLEPKLQENQISLERQVGAIETIANEAKRQADSANLLVEKAHNISTSAQNQADNSFCIAKSADSQAKSAEKEVKILREQLRLAQKEVTDAKKAAFSADILSILAIIVSIVMPLLLSVL